MPIVGTDEFELQTILGEYFTPSKEITDPDRLLGRQNDLTTIARAISSPGRTIFIHGDRGIGKTSLAVTAAKLNNFHDEKFIYVPCGTNVGFGNVIRSVIRSAIESKAPPRWKSASAGISALGFGLQGAVSWNDPTIPAPQDITEAYALIRQLDGTRAGQTIVVIDEFDRAPSSDKAIFSEFIKNFPTLNSKIKLIFCGIGRDVEALLGAHLSSGRYLEAIEVKRLHHNYLWDIVRNVADRLNVDIDKEFLVRTSIISDGFPHFVHLIGQCLFWSMHDDQANVQKCSRKHFKEALGSALKKSEHQLKSDYAKATEKTKNKVEYEEALWALADKSDTKRQVTEIYNSSYRRIMAQRANRDALAKDNFNSRLLTLRKTQHGEVVVGHGSGWFSFRENVFRGFVRLKAETEGVQLVPDF